MNPLAATRSPPLQAHLLGTVRVAVGARPLLDADWPRRTARSLLLLLLATPGHRLPRERVLDLLWPEASPATAANALYLALVVLRRTLEPGLTRGRDSAYLEVGGETVAVRPEVDLWVDADAFETLLAQAETASPLERPALLREALALYGGDLLADEPYTDWPVARREHLRHQRRRATLGLTELEQGSGRTSATIAPLEALVADDPTDEEVCRALIRTLAALGRRDEALRAYEHCRRALAEELDVEPDAETEALVASLRTVVQSIPSLGTALPRFDNLPSPLTPLVGRERELETVQDLLWDPAIRLVTLSGPGGVGKTRLALEAARQAAPDMGDGVCFIPLAALRDPALVLPTMARTLGIEESGGQPLANQLRDALRDREMLLVLDNFESVVEAGAEVTDLLESAPRLKVLVTSREPLHVRGEHELETPPLAVPSSSIVAAEAVGRYDAVDLFLQRARAVRAGFAITDDNAPTVAAICTHLDGLPLAIELAAARVRAMELDELRTGLSHRLDVLIEGYRDLPPRQQTMRDTIAWSYDLLTIDERALFRRLAVCAGGCTLEAAETIAGGELFISEDRGSRVPDVRHADGTFGASRPTLDLIDSLTDKHLLQIEATDDGPRVVMLETIREFGLEQLAACGEDDAVRDAHASLYLAVAEAAEMGLQGAEQVTWLGRLEIEHDNARAALGWLPARDAVEAALRLAGALWFFRWLRGYYAEGRAQYEALLALPGASGRTAARAKALNGLGVTALSQGDTERATAAHEEALAIARELGDKYATAFSLVCLGAALSTRAEFGHADAVTTESLALYGELGDHWGAHMALGNLAISALQRGDHERSEALFTESLAIGRALGVHWGTVLDLDNLGWLALERGDDQRASALFQESLTMMRELRDMRDLPDALAGLGRAAQRQGDLGRAAMLYEEALATARETGDQRGIAQSLFYLSHVVWRQGDVDKALTLVQQALALYHAMGDLLYVAAALEAVAVLAGARGEAERAARLLEAASGLLERVGASIPRYDRFDNDEALNEVREALGTEQLAAVQTAVRELPLEHVVAEALAADRGSRLPDAGSHGTAQPCADSVS